MAMQCTNPDCEYMANPNPEISVGFCCEKCEGRFNGEEWANNGKKKHTAYCTSKEGFSAAGFNAAAAFAAAAPSTWQCIPAAPVYGGELSGAAVVEPEAAVPEKYDDDTEAKLDTWVALKKAKDFEAADIMRDELRAAGIEPGEARPPPGAKGSWGGKGVGGGLWGKGGAMAKGGKAAFGMVAGYGGSGFGAKPCANPECEYLVNSDPSISQFYCCEKCDGFHNGQDWATGKKHYKNCEKIEQVPTPGWGGGGGGYGKAAAWGGKAAGWGGKAAGFGMGGWAGKGKWGPY